jgi:hypothetical protein
MTTRQLAALVGPDSDRIVDRIEYCLRHRQLERPPKDSTDSLVWQRADLPRVLKALAIDRRRREHRRLRKAVTHGR